MLFNLPSFGLGFLAGFVSGFSTRELAAAARPIARGAIKASMQAVDKSREVVAQLGEGFDDLMAEVRSEMDTEPRVSGKRKSSDKELLADKSDKQHGKKAAAQ